MGSYGCLCHFKSLTWCFFPQDNLYRPGALSVTLGGCLWLVLSWRQVQHSAPALPPVRCGAEPRARVSAYLATDVPVRSLNKWLQSSTFSYISPLPEEGNSWIFFIGKALNRTPFCCVGEGGAWEAGGDMGLQRPSATKQAGLEIFRFPWM